MDGTRNAHEPPVSSSQSRRVRPRAKLEKRGDTGYAQACGRSGGLWRGRKQMSTPLTDTRRTLGALRMHATYASSAPGRWCVARRGPCTEMHACGVERDARELREIGAFQEASCPANPLVQLLWNTSIPPGLRNLNTWRVLWPHFYHTVVGQW